MDPNACLAEIRELREYVADCCVSDDDFDLRDFNTAVSRLAELVEALDGWLSSGGFLPLAWQKGR